MARAAFSAVDLKRAVAALEAVGKHIVRVEFPMDGGFHVLTADEPQEAPRAGERRNPLDRVLRAR